MSTPQDEAAPTTGFLAGSGVVVDVAGQPVVGASMHSSLPGRNDSTRSDAEGRFELWAPADHVQPVRWRVSCAGFVRKSFTAPFGVAGLEIVLEPAGTLCGEIALDTLGRMHLSTSELSVRWIPDDSRPRHSGNVGAKGEWRLDGIELGAGRLELHHDRSRHCLARSEPIRLKAGSSETVELALSERLRQVVVTLFDAETEALVGTWVHAVTGAGEALPNGFASSLYAGPISILVPVGEAITLTRDGYEPVVFRPREKKHELHLVRLPGRPPPPRRMPPQVPFPHGRTAAEGARHLPPQ